ncbi:hypothetical protein N7468_008821 [Penicillium chermesinum]|uniref:Uncharacterized protein n=1 Tax=Penicillium chermesinum TaxID=63820 RepID=A0A9W9TE93_9EURO|nr:uncharacterized protein N7468_008821 [Penicillium chermesinum]KAJ5219617.1 hypothetical protein N7468_008821 [Penicillium chermesinum]
MANAQHLHGTIHEYIKGRSVFEFTNNSSVPHGRPHTLLFIAGLNDGLPTVPYVEHIAKALKPTKWSLFWVQLSSAYGAWGTSSLSKDIGEIFKCINFIRDLRKMRSPHEEHGKMVLMGHSTGCQDILYYLTDTKSGSMSQPPLELLPLAMTTKMGFTLDTPFNGYRFLSIASPESPGSPSDDDMFSSDLPDAALAKTFGRVSACGKLKGQLLVLYSECDEYVPSEVDKRALMQRWERATNAGGEQKWDPESGLIPGAIHNVEFHGQDWLIARVHGYLQRVERG